MRGLLAFIGFLGLIGGGVAHAGPVYDIYVLACDGSTDCLRVVEVNIEQAGATTEYNGAGVNLRFDTLTATPDEQSVRLSVSLVPKSMAFASMGSRHESTASRFGFQIEPCTLKRNQYTSLGTFSGGNKFYQVWGRILTPRPRGELVAAR